MSTYLVSGASRGLGLGIIEILALQPVDKVSVVFACTRSHEPNAALARLIADFPSRLCHVHLDVSSKTSIISAVNTVAVSLHGNGLDYLINNAAVRENSWTPKLEDMTYLRDALEINVAGTHDVIAAFLPLLRKGAERKIILLSSTLGCITTAQTDRKLMDVAYPAYKISKAGTHMLTALWSNQLRPEGFCVYMQSPGNLKTELAGGENADLPVEVGANQVVQIAQAATVRDTGRHRNIWVLGWEDSGGVGRRYDGKDLPW